LEYSEKVLGILVEVLKKTRESIFLFDRNGRIVYANDIAYSETEYQDFSEVNITEIFPMAIHRGHNGVTWQSGDYMQTFAYRQNKTCYPVKLTCCFVDATEGENIVAFAINDSERYNAVRNHRKAMEDVEAANKMKNEFTANITHELRTPINGIKGMAEGLMNTEMTPQQEETVGIILHCCSNMTQIINDILDFSKIEAGKIEIVNAEFSLKKFMNDQLAFHSVKINEKGLKLMVNISRNVPDYVIGDELRLGQVLNNLFSNAIKFTAQGQIAIELTANKLGGGETELFFLVMDSGIGISDEEKDKLFKSFSQVDGSITRRYGGTGLGLAITKQLVTLMGGTISMDSEKGKGSTFSFTVKVHESDKKASDPVAFPEGSFEFSKSLPVASKENISVGDYDLSGSAPALTAEDMQDVPQYAGDGMDEEDGMSILRSNLEKLMICIELGSWEKAENFATTIRNYISQNDPERKNKAFSLLLNVRKEKYDLAMALIKELGDIYGV
jgi:nitrogen-specific signal transduction histidine kinase